MLLHANTPSSLSPSLSPSLPPSLPTSLPPYLPSSLPPFLQRWVAKNRADCPHCRASLSTRQLIRIPVFDDLCQVRHSNCL